MSYLETPEHKVGSAAYQLRQTIADLWAMRLKSETADLVIDEQFSLTAAFNSLSALVEDVRVARDNMKVAAE